MRTCAACGREARSFTRARVFHDDGTNSGGLVCRTCAARGLLLVSSRKAPVVKTVVQRPDAIDRALRMLRTFASAARRSGLDGRAEGLESAIETIKREGGS